MASLLRVDNPGLARFLDPAGDDYVNAIVGPGATTVSCTVYPFAPANQILGSSATLLINGTVVPFSPAPSSGPQNPLPLSFTIGNNPAVEQAGTWNTITISVQDNDPSGGFSSFTFYFYKVGAPGATTTTTTTTTTGAPTTTTGAPTTTTTRIPRPRRRRAKVER